MNHAWPWALTPLTGRAIGAWLVGLGVTAALAAWENDRRRVAVVAISYGTLAALQAIALARFGEEVDWGGPAAILYAAFLAAAAAVALAIWRPGGRHRGGRARST